MSEISSAENNQTSNLVDTNQLGIDSSTRSHTNNEISQTQVNDSSISGVNNVMSNLSMNENRSNSNYSYSRSNRPFYQQTRVAQSANQAELTAFTQPLMSIEFPYSPTSYRPRNYYSQRPYTQNQQTYVPTKTTAQPEYYVDSFQSNFSNKSSSNTQSDNNSSTKTKVKHVTFEEPEQVNERYETYSNPYEYYQTQSYTNHYSTYRNPRSFNRYNSSQYYNYNPMNFNQMFTTRSHRLNPMSPSWIPNFYYTNLQVPHTRRLYDPNEPKVQSSFESQDSSKIVSTKIEQKSKPILDQEESVLTTQSNPLHPITILRRPSSESEVSAATVENEQSDNIPTFPSHELLSILQSANCISSLNEYSQQQKFLLKYDYSSTSSSSFTCTLSINNHAFPSSPSCSSKVDAQKLACDQVLRILYRKSCLNDQSSFTFSDKHDYIAHRSVSTFHELNVNDLLLGRKTLACMLMITNNQFEQARVISIATGNTCLDEINISYATDGSVLHDCHAEILARRGLIKFFFEQLKQAKENQSSIFEYNSTMNKYDLNENITFHMYISSLPCGNASVNLPTNFLRYKQGQIEGTQLASTSSVQYPIKSCSDKILRWNILGIQGGLLVSLLVKPIYLETITIASEATLNRERLQICLCEYLKNNLASLPQPYEIHCPEIDCPKLKAFQQESHVSKLQTNAFAWNTTLNNRTELLEPMTGKLKTSRSMSILSKQSFFRDFQNLSSNECSTYYQAKQLNETYVQVKKLISEAFEKSLSDSDVSWMLKTFLRPLQALRVVHIPVRTTIIVERVHPLTKLRPGENIYDYSKYKYADFQYRVIKDTDAEKWGNIDVILTDYVEGVGYKGEIVNVTREMAYTELLPTQLALYPTPENVALFEEERKSLVDRPQISPFVKKCRDYLQTIVLQIPINIKHKEWTLTRDNIRIALRRINIMCDEEAILLDEGSISQNTYKPGEEFNVTLKINPLVDVSIKCVIIPVDKAKLWDEYQLSKRRPKT